jgi:hypothetical protein
MGMELRRAIHGYQQPCISMHCGKLIVIKKHDCQVVPSKDAGLPSERRKSASDRMSDERQSKREDAVFWRLYAAWMYFCRDPIFVVSR